jgi:hypothetical protein
MPAVALSGPEWSKFGGSRWNLVAISFRPVVISISGFVLNFNRIHKLAFHTLRHDSIR